VDNDITLNRKIQKWGWYKNSNTKDVFLHLLINANWHDGEYFGHPILRGQCMFGRKQFSDELGISEQSVRTAINHLKSTSEITIKSTNKFSVITIVKYSDYQPLPKDINQQDNLQPNIPSTNDQPTTNHIQEYKNIRTIKNNSIPPYIPPAGEKSKSKKDEPKKDTYGEFENVLLTVEEYEKLLNTLGNQTQSYIDRLDGYIASKGVKYKSHYATILNWWRKDGQAKPQEKKSSGNIFADIYKEEHGIDKG
jgi:hypothetical protein